MVNDHDRHLVGHLLKLLRRILVERGESVLDARSHGEATGERHLAAIAIAILLPIVSRHQSIREHAAERVVDVEHHDNGFGRLHAALGESLLEVRHAVGILLEGVLAVMLLDRTDNSRGNRVVQHELAAHFAHHGLRGVVAPAPADGTGNRFHGPLDAGRLLGERGLLILQQDDLATPDALPHALDVVRRRANEGGLVALADLHHMPLEMAHAAFVVAVFARFAFVLDANALADDLVVFVFQH